MSNELLQQALDALTAMQMEAAARSCGLLIADEAIDALRAAIAQPVQPVQPTMEKILHLVHVLENSAAIDGRENHPSDRTEQAYEQVVFALREALAQPVQPAKRVPLTIEQIDTALNSIQALYWDVPTNSTEDFVRAIEAAHGIKETK